MNKRRGFRAIQLLILATAFGMLVYGIYRGEVVLVLNKAINICMECIGLG